MDRGTMGSDTHSGDRWLLPVPSGGVSNIRPQKDDRLLEHRRPVGEASVRGCGSGTPPGPLRTRAPALLWGSACKDSLSFRHRQRTPYGTEAQCEICFRETQCGRRGRWRVHCTRVVRCGQPLRLGPGTGGISPRRRPNVSKINTPIASTVCQPTSDLWPHCRAPGSCSSLPGTQCLWMQPHVLGAVNVSQWGSMELGCSPGAF